MKTKEMEKVLREEVKKVVTEALSDAVTAASKLKKITDLEKRIKELEIEKSQREWEFKKREMEVEHKVGLERKRQEFESDEARRTAILEVKEENLSAKQDRFEEQMKFISERFTSEVGYLKEILGQVLSCLVKGGNDDFLEETHSKCDIFSVDFLFLSFFNCR